MLKIVLTLHREYTMLRTYSRRRFQLRCYGMHLNINSKLHIELYNCIIYRLVGQLFMCLLQLSVSRSLQT